MNVFESYVNRYPVQKTLKFSLIPVNKTLEHIKKAEILNYDEKQKSDYKDVKLLFDKNHKAFIQNFLSECADNFDWEELYKRFKEPRNKNDNLLEKKINEYEKSFKTDLLNDFGDLQAKKIIDAVCAGKETLADFNNEEREQIKLFKKFSSRFNKYNSSRKNLYKNDIPKRILRENFPKFAGDIKLFETLDEEIVHEFEQELKDAELLNFNGETKSMQDVFSANFYKNLLVQSGIDFYNTLLGGYSKKDNSKAKGLNELCNLAYQNNKINQKKNFAYLKKQILGDYESKSFIYEPFKEDKEVIGAVNNYAKAINKIISDNKDNLKETLCNLGNSNTKNIFVKKGQIKFLFQLFNCSDEIDIAFSNENANPNKKNKKLEKEIYTLYNLSKKLEKTAAECTQCVHESYAKAVENMESAYKILKDNKITSFDRIKTYLDSVLECEKKLKIFACSDDELDLQKDAAFYSVFDVVYDAFRESIPLYNKVRNYATGKLAPKAKNKKYKLTFENPTLANGWNINKETDYATLLFRKNNIYYLGVINQGHRKDFKKIKFATPVDDKDKAEKFIFRNPSSKSTEQQLMRIDGEVQLKTKDLDCYRELYIDSEINKIIKKIKNKERLETQEVKKYIDYYKPLVAEFYYKRQGLEIKFKDEYSSIDEFSKDIKNAYQVSCQDVSFKQIEELVEKNKLFLFKIYNKDFSDYSKGKPNLHTLYWKELFSEENIANPLFKLNGNAELFYRPQIIDNPHTHKKGQVLIGKIDKDQKPVDSQTYISAQEDAQSGMSIADLSKKYPALNFKTAEWEIVKDKRYSAEQFSFHVPITINYAAKISNEFNTSVIETIKGNPDVNIIGIDRGERNLLYVSCINQKGEILVQKSLNVINEFNYQEKLNTIEHKRKTERKNWQQISKIKDVKNGYLSMAVKEIAEMMINYNAIVVLEALSFGFKQGQAHIEKQVYQNFEKMLINKLNYYADKSLDRNEAGSIRRGYQLTEKFESFQKIGRQTGFLFYVPAQYTSKIDYYSGFVNLFTSKQLKYKNKDNFVNFIKSFDSISYNSATQSFKFDFNYDNFELNRKDYTNKWAIYSCGEGRIIDGRYKTKVIDVTAEMKNLLQRYEISYESAASDTPNLKGEIIDAANKAGKSFCQEFLMLFQAIVQLRYQDAKNDFILSPAMCGDKFFDTRNSRPDAEHLEPCDGDANGAYHIALRGLHLLQKISKEPDSKENVYDAEWFEFAQTKPFKK